MRLFFVATMVAVCAGEVAAQVPGQTPGFQYPTQPNFGGYPQFNQQTVMPNIYNPATQPLSPYLNLLRGGNAGVNYFYGVRPGTVGGWGGRSGGAPFVAAGGPRTPFFPHLAAAPDPLEGNDADPGAALPSAGHPVLFNNTMGYFPSPLGQAGGARPGLAGLGATRPRR